MKIAEKLNLSAAHRVPHFSVTAAGGWIFRVSKHPEYHSLGIPPRPARALFLRGRILNVDVMSGEWMFVRNQKMTELTESGDVTTTSTENSATTEEIRGQILPRREARCRPAAMRRHFLYLVVLCLSCAAWVSCRGSSDQQQALNSPDLSVPVLAGEALIKNEQNDQIQPWALESATDSGYIIAGSAGEKGWAAKIDANGKVLWEYYTSLREERRSTLGQGYDPVGEPTYYGAVSMQDGSYFLCGHMPRSTRSGEPQGLITHLNAQGKLIKESLIAPVDRAAGLEEIERCARWGNGLAIFGVYNRVIPVPNTNSNRSEPFFWILSMDRSGKALWEKLIPAADTSSPSGFLMVVSRGVVLQESHADLLISVIDSKVPGNSQILRVNPTGEVTARRSLPGDYRLIRTISSGGALQLWGRDNPPPHKPTPDRTPSSILRSYGLVPEGSPTNTILLTLNEHLDVINKAESAAPSVLSPTTIYRMPDQSYVLFGGVVHPPSHTFRTGIAHVDGNLHVIRSFEPIYTTGRFTDGAQVDAVTPLIDGNGFAVAMSVASKDLANHGESSDISSDFSRGVDLNFVDLR